MKKLFLTFLIALTASSGMLAADPPGLGPFSIAPDKQIYFAPGNLQYQPSTDTWRFAPNQYDVIGDNNLSLYPTYDGWIDLFTWGSGNNPIGLAQTTASNNYVDWGVNVIDNYPANSWRALTANELNYILTGREDSRALWATATVCDVNGIILMPDDFRSNQHTGVGMWNGSKVYYTDNVLSAGDWARWEAAGAVFLPSAGLLWTDPAYRMGNVGTAGYYWTSSADSTNSSSAYEFSWHDSSSSRVFLNYYAIPTLQNIAHSVRLIYGAPESECEHQNILLTEDFGGNEPSDPAICATPYPNLAASYTQSYDNMGSGKAMITKRGWVNPFSTTWSDQCDHTFEGDYQRGYFMEVDGLGDGAPVVSYPLQITPPCMLHCECYVANVDAYSRGGSFAFAQLALEVVDRATGRQLGLRDSGPLPQGSYMSTPWIKLSLDLDIQVAGRAVEFRILNTATSMDGNDFAIDDISVWECTDILPIEFSGCDSVEYSPQGGTTEVFYKDTTFVDQSGAQVEIKVHNSVHTARTLQGEEEVVYQGVTYTESTTLFERDTTEFGCERVDTIHIDVTHVSEEYLDSLIVNEMNWIICCNNRLLRAHYPADTYEYQWYKDGQAVSSYYPDYHDYYTEDRRLQGEFYLIVKAATDANGTMTYKRVRSNTITIAAPSLVSVSPNPASQGEVISITAEGPFQYRLVTLSGLCLTAGSAEQNALLPVLPQGIYLVEILQENEVSTLKLMVR